MKISILTTLDVKGNFIKGLIFNDKKSFRLSKLFDKRLSLGYSHDFSKEQLGEFIQELQAVHNNMGDSDCETNTKDKEAT
jgi:hypothetical protein